MNRDATRRPLPPLARLGGQVDVVPDGSCAELHRDRLGQGRNNAKAFLDEHLEIAREIEGKVYEATGLNKDLVVPIERDESVDVPDLEGPIEASAVVEQAA